MWRGPLWWHASPLHPCVHLAGQPGGKPLPTLLPNPPAPAAEERQSGGASPDPEEAGPLPPPASPGAWRPLHFACDSPACRKLLCRPVVLTCGHSVCQLTCLPSCCCCGGGEGATAWECPACGMATRQPPAVCKQLGDLLVQLFPEESARREAECQQAAQERVAAEGGGGGSGSVQPPSQSQQVRGEAAAGQGEEAGTPRAPAAGSAAGSHAAAGAGEEGGAGGGGGDTGPWGPAAAAGAEPGAGHRAAAAPGCGRAQSGAG